MEDKVAFSKNVILIDVTFLNDIVYNVRNSLGNRLGRELSQVDLPEWLSCLALDAGLKEGDNEIQVLLVHDGASTDLKCCIPSDLNQLNGMACRTPLGEFIFTSVSAEGIVPREDLYLNLLNLALDSADVKCLMIVPFHLSYGDRVEEDLRKFFKGKSKEECNKAVYFVLEAPKESVLCMCDPIFYSVAKALGIQADEL